MKNLLILTGLAAIGYIVWSQLHKGSEKDANGTISPADSLISDMKPYQNEQAAPGKPGLFPNEISKQFDTSVDETVSRGRDRISIKAAKKIIQVSDLKRASREQL